MKHLSIIVLVSISLLDNTKVNAQNAAGNFDSLLVAIKKINHQKAIEQLAVFEEEHLSKLSCGDKGLFYKEFGIRYYKIQDYLNAEEKYSNAIEAFTDCEDFDLSQLARTNYNAARNAQKMGDIVQVKHMINQFSNVSDQISNYERTWFKKIINNARLLANIGEIKLSEFYTEKAFSFVNELSNPEPEQAYLYSILARTNLDLKQEIKALKNLQQANLIYKKHPSTYRQLINNKINIAVAHYGLQNFDSVRQTINEIEAFSSKHNVKIQGEALDILKNLMKIEDRDFEGAIKNYQTKINQYNSNPSKYLLQISSTYDNIASAYSKAKQFELAEANLDSSLNLFLIDQGQNIESYLKNEILYHTNPITKNLQYRADLNFENYLENDNIELLKQNASLFNDIEKIFIKKLNLSRDDISKLSLITHIKPMFEDAVKHFLEISNYDSENYLDKAYKYASSIKGIVLKEGTKAKNALYSTLPDSVFQKERQLSQDLTQLENVIPSLTDQNVKDSLLTKYIIDKKNYDKFISQIEKNYPDYYSLKYANEKPLNLKEVQSQLNKNELVLDYFVTRDTVICFGISQNNISVNGIAFNQELKDHISNFRNKIEKNDLISTELNAVLFDALISKNLASHKEINKLIILPDEDLLKVPFDVLYNGTSFLIQDYAISYLYSNNQISESTSSKAKYDFAGFGTKYSSQLTNNLENKIDAEYLPLNQLPMAPLEIQNAQGIWGGDAYLNEKATKDNFIKKSSQYKILHLALHGIVNNEYLDQSALIFDDQEDDNILKTNELYLLKLNNQLTILTACNSANGKVFKGEGIRSIARGFAFAGCPSIVSSMWTAYDEPTNKIISSFNKYLKEGQDKSMALRQAKLDFIEGASPTQNQPQLWANLILIGNTEPMQSNGINSMYLIGAALFLFILIFFYTRKK